MKSATPMEIPVLSQEVKLPIEGSRLQPVGLLLGWSVLAVIFAALSTDAWVWMFRIWMTRPDDSHGLLVPFFAAALLWMRRDRAKWSGQVSVPTFVLGVVVIAIATGLKGAGIYCRMMTLEAASIIPFVAGIVICVGGMAALKVAWPSICFLVFMVPLPQVIGMRMGGTLQQIATVCSTYALQFLGMPAVAEGNVIYLTDSTLGVAEACSGIRMLMTFFALTTAICFVVDRPMWEKVLIWLSAPLIAVIANVLRITATGIGYEFGNAKVAELIFHDLAGWLMMPVALLLLWGELFLISRLMMRVEHEDLSHALRRTKRNREADLRQSQNARPVK